MSACLSRRHGLSALPKTVLGQRRWATAAGGLAAVRRLHQLERPAIARLVASARSEASSSAPAATHFPSEPAAAFVSSSSAHKVNGYSEQQQPIASSSELLKAVLQRRAERLQRQQDSLAQQQQQQQALGEAADQQSAAHPMHVQVNGVSNGSAAAEPPSATADQHALVPAGSGVGGLAAVEETAFVPSAPLSRKMATVRFWLKFKAQWGQRIKVVGSHEELGRWILSRAPELKWSEGDNWHTTLQLPSGGVVEYKYVLMDHSGNHAVAWQQGNNSVLAVRTADELVEVFDNWGGDPGAKVIADGGKPVTRENRLLTWANEVEAQLVSQRQDLRRARMELASAQQEAREARAEARNLKHRLAASEAEKVEVVTSLKQARALNEALQSQLADTTASFQEALRTAADILGQIDEVSGLGVGSRAGGLPSTARLTNLAAAAGAAGAAGSSSHTASPRPTPTPTTTDAPQAAAVRVPRRGRRPRKAAPLMPSAAEGQAQGQGSEGRPPSPSSAAAGDAVERATEADVSAAGGRAAAASPKPDVPTTKRRGRRARSTAGAARSKTADRKAR